MEFFMEHKLDGPGGPGGPGGFGGPGGPGGFGGPGGPGGPGGFGGPPKASYKEIRPETDWIIYESCTYNNGIILKEGSLPAAPEGSALLMLVDGVPTTIAPDIYPGKVEFIVYSLVDIPEDQADLTTGTFRTAIYVHNGEIEQTGLEKVAGDFTVDETGISGLNLSSNIAEFNGVMLDGENQAPFVISNSVFRCNGSGNSEGKGACITALGKTNVKVQNNEFWNKGTLTAIMAAGHSKVEVDHCVVYGAKDFTAGKLCPWVLGINGNNRLTNAIESAHVYYHDSIVVAQSWAALSTDAGPDVSFTGERLFSGIGRLEEYNDKKADEYTAVPVLNGKKYGFSLGNSAIGECGYINYADTGFHNTFKDCTFWSPDYIFILSTSDASIDISGDSYCYSGRIGVMRHKNQGGTVSLKDGKWYAEQTLFLTKTWSPTDTDGCYCHAIIDGTEVTLGENGVLYQLMGSDDVGLGADSTYIVPEIEWHPERIQKLPETYRTQKQVDVGFMRKEPVWLVDGKEIISAQQPLGSEPVIIDASYRIQPCTFELRNVETSGNIYNGVYERIQELHVTMDYAKLTGSISSANTWHANADGTQADAGTKYSKSGEEDEHLGIGRVGNTPSMAINNPVQLALRNSSVWNVVGTNYLNALSFDSSSKVNGIIEVDGCIVSAAGHYVGNIVITAC